MKTMNNMNSDRENIMGELNLDEMEQVNGGGLKEIVAGVTLAAMTMTGNTVSAFTMARAMAEESACIEAAPEETGFSLEAPVEETVQTLGGDEAEVMASEADMGFVEEEEAPAVPTFEVGARQTLKLGELASALGITGEVSDVGVTDETDAGRFMVFTDADGDLAIEFTRGFDRMELGFVTSEGIQMGALLNAQIDAQPAEAVEVNGLSVEYEAAAQEIGDNEEVKTVTETGAETEVETGVEALPEEAAEAMYALTEDGAERVTEDAAAEAEAVTDRNAMMTGLIAGVVETHRDEGIYGALDSVFATLAENADDLANPETGVIESEGNVIINATFDALNANFNENPEQLMGAIGAAALRAEDAGYIQALGGDAVLSAMAAEEGDAEVDLSMAKDLTKDYLELGIDTLADVHPAFKALSPLLKGLLGVAFDESQPDPMQEIQNKLDEIDQKLDEIEESVKSHTDNVVSLSNRGLAFDNIVANSKTLRTRMNNIWDPDSGYTQAEKIQQTADLYKTDYVKDLETALNGGTMAYEGTLKDFLDGQSVFEAAYRTACESVMFSSEAIDSTAPYLYQVLADYIVGYNLLDEVYDCYEAVYGANKLLASRDDMNARLAGIDRKGNKVCKSVMDLYVEYFKRDRYIFVGKSNNKNIKLNDTMVLVQNFAKECQINDNIMKTPDYMKNNPLSDKDVQLIADYCKEKRTSLFQYLLNEMKFDLKVVYNNKTYTASDFVRDPILSTRLVATRSLFATGWAYNIGPLNGKKNSEFPQKIYLATGKQYITQNDKCSAYGMGVTSTNYWYYAQGFDTTGRCTGKNEKVQIMKRTRDSAPLEKKNTAKDTDYYCSFMFFQGR